MPVKARIIFNKSEIAFKVRGASAKAAESVAIEILKDSNLYAPVRYGILTGDPRADAPITYSSDDFPKVSSYPEEGRAVISWNVPYARKMYEGKTKSGKAIRYSKDPNPNAQAKWFEKARSLKLADWRKHFEKQLKQEMEGGNG